MSLLVSLTAASSGLVLATVTGAHATSHCISDPPEQSATFPPQADIIATCATYENGTIVVGVAVAQQTDPTTDRNWQNDTFIKFGVDVHPGGTRFQEQFAVDFHNVPGTNQPIVKVFEGNTAICDGHATWSDAGFNAVFPASCLGNPSQIYWDAYMQYQYGQGPYEYQTDYTPKDTYETGPVTPSGVAQGYWLLGQDGGVFSFGNASFHGSTGGLRLNRPVVGLASRSDRNGYWFVASDGGIFSFDAPFFGSAGSIRLNQPIVGMAATPDGGGYWLVASDGGIFGFGTAHFFGSAGGIKLNKPIVAMTPTADGNGYWFVASDGGVFNYGDAAFFGSGSGQSSSPVVGMASTPDGKGYWLATADGGVESFGDARSFGSGANQFHAPVVGIATTADGGGYRLVAADGEVGAYGDAGPLGSVTGHLNAPIVGIA